MAPPAPAGGRGRGAARSRIMALEQRRHATPPRPVTGPARAAVNLLDETRRAWMRLRWGPTLHEPATRTRFDAHPDVLRAARAAIAGDAPRLLSFGCSTGEELLTLRAYFPRAEIVGVDINPRCLRAARRRCRADAAIRVQHASAPIAGRFDGVFCLAVFDRRQLRDEATANADTIYPFAVFEGELRRLDALLRRGGVLALDGAGYRFGDTALAPRYDAVPAPLDAPRVRRRYGRDNRLIGSCDEPTVLWRKRADGPRTRPDRGRPSRLGGLARRSPLEQLRIAEAVLLAEAAVLAVKVVPFRAIVRALDLAPGSAPAAGPGDLETARAVAAAVSTAARHAPIPAVCLPQALAARVMLARRGIPSTLCLGVRRDDRGALLAHAWVEVGGTTVLGDVPEGTYRRVASFA